MGTSYSIFGQAVTATTIRTDGPFQLGTEFIIKQDVWVTGFRFRRPNTVAQTITMWVFNQSDSGGTNWLGRAGGSLVLTAGGATGWRDISTSDGLPVKLTFNAATAYRNRYRVVTRATNFCETGYYWTTGPGSAGFSNAVMDIPNYNNALNNAQSSWATNNNEVSLNNSTGGPNWWSEIVVSDVDPRMKSNAITLFGGA